jgi:glycosyltransferase involved in cell wall biosynthesis
VRSAIDSILRQTVPDLELILVDDASTDKTPGILQAVSDKRVGVITNDRQLGLGASLNRGLERAQGRYVARLDSDDVAFPRWLELLLARVNASPPAAIVGTGIVEVDVTGRPGRIHELPRGAVPIRWHALFSAPFFHSTLLIDREVLHAHGLRYDPAYLESEDYDLWTRLLAVADGDNLADPLVLRRMHPAQAQARRGDLQRSFQQQVALREIARVAPKLTATDADLAWRLAVGLERGKQAADAYLALLERFEQLNGVNEAVRQAAARTLGRAGHVRRGLRLAPSAPVRMLGVRLAGRRRARKTHRAAEDWLNELLPAPERLHVAVISPEPTPYRAPLFDRIAARPDVELTVLYAARTVADRSWSVEPRHRATYLRGVRLPGVRRLLRHDYPVTPGVSRALRDLHPDVVVVSGWSTFSSQAALGWARAHRVPYVLLVESHDLGPRSGWRRAVKGAVVPRLLRGAASVLVVGTAARESVVARGADSERVRVFANTIDVERWIERANNLPRRHDDRTSVVFSVGRLVPEKAFDILAQACAEAGVDLMLAGDGPERDRLQEFGTILGDIPEEELARRYVEADVFALLSRHEPWGVVVNEAAASGLPLVLSDRVGAAHDLLLDGENGFLVPPDDAGRAAAALGRLAGDPELRRSMGARSRELVRAWGYEPSVESFVAAVREAAAR